MYVKGEDGAKGRPSRDEIELKLWRVTGSQKVEEIDQLLDMVDRYAGRLTKAELNQTIRSGLMSPEEMRQQVEEFEQMLAEVVAENGPKETVDEASEGSENPTENPTKECSRCKKVKGYGEFGSDKTAKTGRRSRCKSCESEVRYGKTRD